MSIINYKMKQSELRQIMENQKWKKEEAEQNKNNLLKEIMEMPISENTLEWVTKELNQLIDEEEVRQNNLTQQ